MICAFAVGICSTILLLATILGRRQSYDEVGERGKVSDGPKCRVSFHCLSAGAHRDCHLPGGKRLIIAGIKEYNGGCDRRPVSFLVGREA